MRYKKINILKLLFLILFLSNKYYINGQIINFNELKSKNGIFYYSNIPFSGKSLLTNTDSTYSIQIYYNGLLNGDSAIVIRYLNNAIKSVASYNNGKLISKKENEYFELRAFIIGAGYYVYKDILASKKQLDICLGKLSKKQIISTPKDSLISDPLLDLTIYRIISFVFSPKWCTGCPDVEISTNSNQITKDMKYCIKNYRSNDFYFGKIRCTNGRDTFNLPDIRFRLMNR